MSRIRVLQVLDNLGMGGAETWILALLQKWKDDPNAPQMEILCTGGTRGTLEAEARALGAKIHYLRYSQARLLSFSRGFRRLLRAGVYDALHDHQDYAAGWHYMLGGDVLPPVRIAHVHNPAYQVEENYGRSIRGRLTARIGKAMIARHATYITGTSRQAVTEHGFDASDFDHIPKIAAHCGIDTSPFAIDRAASRDALRAEFGWERHVRIVLFAGRIDAAPDPDHVRNHKNSGLAVSIAIAACQLDLDLHVIFAGPPSAASPILERRVSEAGLSNRIRLIGVRRDIARLMRGADALLFPSRSEGLGMVAVEAQAAGLPVLASTGVPRECIVVPELVSFMDVNSGLVPWAQQLIRLAAAPRYTGDANAKVACSNFSIENSAARLAELYAGHLKT